jgi:predicted ester cyclase
MAQARELVEQAWSAIESGSFDRFGDIFSADAELRTSSAAGAGIDYVRGVFTRHLQAYPDMRHAVLDCVEGDGAVALEMEFTATHRGELRGPNGSIAPTGRQITWRSSDHIRVANGRIVSWHAYFDRLAQREQLGLQVANGS